MPRTLHPFRYGLVSLGLHGLLVAALYFFLGGAGGAPQEATPVRIVDLPPHVVKRLPPVRPSIPWGQSLGSYGKLPAPEQTGKENGVELPKTVPYGVEKGSGTGGPTPVKPDTGAGSGTGDGKSPLPFLTQAEIEELARKGMPKKKPGEEAVTLDTDEFKFISYNRWLEEKLNSALHVPEIVKVSGLQGIVYIRLDIMQDGSIGKVEVVKSSGYKILDDSALNAIKDSAPFQQLPSAWGMERYPLWIYGIFYYNKAYIR